MNHYLYLILNLSAIFIPLLAGFDRRLRFDKQWMFVFPAMLLTMVVFIPWDMLKTSAGVWGFNPRYISGIFIGNLPIEEWMFFIAIPYACLFTYHSLNYLVKRDYLGRYANHITVSLAFILLVLGFLHLNKLYTSVTFISTGSFLLVMRFVVRPHYWGRFYMMYLVTLIPFFIINGILTGSWIQEAVVHYDNSQNLGIRIGTIPIEDMVYGLLMLLMNVGWYEGLRRKFE